MLSKKLLMESEGILRLAPAWVPRTHCRPGRRIKLDPRDLYVLGKKRGGIDERWFASTTWADNGPETPPDEGLSYVVSEDGESRVLLREMVEELGAEIIGQYLWDKYHRWPMFSKFFDNAGPLPHHIHHRDQHAARVGCGGKPEMYFFPSQMNNHDGEFPHTYFGLNPECTKEQIRECLVNFDKGDNGILEYSRAYKIALDTGWDVPPGVLHAPASLCTYEPQFASDVYCMYQSVMQHGECVADDLLWKNAPEEEIGNFDYLMDVIDWEANTDRDFYAHRFMAPLPCNEAEGVLEEWVCYKSDKACAKRLTIQPGAEALITDAAAYGFILIQGYGDMWAKGSTHIRRIETPTMIRYGALTNDEFFVTEAAAKKGIVIRNISTTEQLVMLKHFSENEERPK